MQELGEEYDCLLWETVHAIKPQPVITYFCFSFAISQKDRGAATAASISAGEKRWDMTEEETMDTTSSLWAFPLIKKNLHLCQLSVYQLFNMNTGVCFLL